MTPLYTINFYQNQFKTFLAIVFMGQNDIHANVAKHMVVVRNLLIHVCVTLFIKELKEN